MESLKMKIRHIARRLAEEELKKHHRGGIVAYGQGEGEAMHKRRHHMTRAHKSHGMALIDTYGLDVEGGKRKVGRPRKARAGIIAYGMDEMDDMGMGERMHKSKKHHMSRGRALDENYGLEVVSGGRRTYHKEGKEYVRRTRKPSAYNMFVKEYILKHKGSNISHAAAAWRSRN